MWFFKNHKIRGATRSPKWSSVRKEFLQDHPCCAVCGSCSKPEVHHIVPVHVDPTKELELDNLITLCDKYCHFIFGHLFSWHSWNKNIVSDAKAYNQKIKNRKD